MASDNVRKKLVENLLGLTFLGSGQKPPVRYLLRANFNRANIALAAGDLQTQAPGSVQDGAFTIVETDGALEIKNNALEGVTAQATPVQGDLGGRSPTAITRVLGRGALVSTQKPAANTRHDALIWSLSNSVLAPGAVNWRYFFDFDTDGNIYTGVANAKGPIRAAYTAATTYQLAIVLGGFNSSNLPYYAGQNTANYTQGVWFLIKGGAFTNWTLLHTETSGTTATLYAQASTFDAKPIWDNLRVPDVDLSSAQVPVAFSSFTAANGTSLDAITPEVGPAWVHQQGTFHTQSNRVEANSNANADNATQDASSANVIVRGTVNNYDAGGNEHVTSLTVRHQNVNNWWDVQARTATDVFRLLENTNGTFTERASASVTLNSGTDYNTTAIPDGTTITCYLDNANRISYASATAGQTETKHGLRIAVVGSPGANKSKIDNFVVYPRTSTAYNILDTV